MSKTANRVKETTTTTGTGTYSLAGAVTGFQTFVAGIGNGKRCYYCVEDGTNWEIGIGTVTDATPDTLARTAILASSNSGSAVNWGAGTRNAFVTIPPEGIAVDPAINGGRLSVSDTNPTPAPDAADSSTLYFIPFVGNRIALYDGTSWRLHTIPDAGVAISVVSDDVDKVYDIFVYDADGAGTLGGETVAWSNHGAGTGARTVSLTKVSGVYTKSSDATKRYVGTIRTVSNSGTKVRDQLGFRYVWNYQNRVKVEDYDDETANSWNVSGNGTWSGINGSSALPWRHQFVVGLDTPFNAEVHYTAFATSGNNPSCAVGMNSSTAIDRTKSTIQAIGVSSTIGTVARLRATAPAGYNYVQGIETTSTTGTTTAYGDNGATVGGTVTGIQSGMGYGGER